jgi:hypothetical protein
MEGLSELDRDCETNPMAKCKGATRGGGVCETNPLAKWKGAARTVPDFQTKPITKWREEERREKPFLDDKTRREAVVGRGRAQDELQPAWHARSMTTAEVRSLRGAVSSRRIVKGLHIPADRSWERPSEKWNSKADSRRESR